MSTINQPPPVHFDAVHRFTIEDYYRLADVGILEAAERTELLDGQVIPMSPVGSEHQWILETLLKSFVRQQDERFEIGPVRSLPLPRHNQPEPDLMLYRPGAAGRHQHVQAPDILLLIEISDSTLRRDLGFKADLYQNAGVPEYWVVDVAHNCVHVFTLVGAAYEKAVVGTATLSPRVLPGIKVSVSDLFGTGEPQS